MPKNPIVILTRKEEDNLVIAEKLGNKQIRSFHYPCIQISYQEINSFGSDIKSQFEGTDLFIFSSRRGVRGFKFLFGNIIRKDQRIAVVGKSSAAEVKKEFGRAPDLVPEIPTGEFLARRVAKEFNPSDTIFFIRGNKTTGFINKILTEEGFSLIELEVYKNEIPILKPLSISRAAIVLFASPSAVKCFFEYNTRLLEEKGWKYLAIGPTTAKYLRSLNVTEVIQASDTNVDSIVNNIEQAMKNNFEYYEGDFNDQL